MKRIYLVRHAKSDWHNNLEDFDRPLNNRGETDAPEMAKRIKEMGFVPDIIISSPAKRAITTAKYFASVFKYSHECIQEERSIYDVGQRYTLKLITELPETLNSPMIFGHNPDHSYLATYLSNSEIGNMPTCSVVGIEFDTDSWEDIKKAKSTLLFFEFPLK